MAATTTTAPSDPPISSTPVVMSHHEEGPTPYFCRHCQCVYSNPRILQCLHSFCTRCLEDLVVLQHQASPRKVPTDNSSLTCPVCSHPTTLPPGGVTALTSNSFLQRVSLDYVTEMKTNLASKAAEDARQRYHDVTPTGISTTVTAATTTSSTSAFRQDLDHPRFANMTDEQKFHSVRTQSDTSEASEDAAAEGSSIASMAEGVANRGRLQAKLVGLQEEALRVTYAIDRVNHHKLEWIQHREDLKRAIQRRSAHFQMLVKKAERQLVAQIDDKGVEGKLYDSFERGKMALRKNLKQALHEVSVMKAVKEMGRHEEINELSPHLLAPSVGTGEVTLNKISYEFDLPTKSIEEMITVGFGSLVMATESRSVYVPEVKDYINLKMDDVLAEAGGHMTHAFAYKRAGIVSAISGDTTMGGSKRVGLHRSSSAVGRQGQRRESDLGKTNTLEEIQNARESLRSRRQEILQQTSSMDVTTSSSTRGGGGGEGGRSSRPQTRQSRGQSLERGLQGSERTQATRKTLASSSSSFEDRGHAGNDPHSSTAFRSDVTVPSPILEENAALTSLSPSSKDVKDVSSSTTRSAWNSSTSPARTGSLLQNPPVSPIGPGGVPDKTWPQEILHVPRSPKSSCSSGSSSRRVSIDRISPCMSPTSELTWSGDFTGRESSRQLRRAITGAADKKSKIEFLRENWQKRKEILIQTQGFVSSEEVKSPKPDSKTVVALIASNGSSPGDAGSKSSEGGGLHSQIPLASRGIGSPPLRSKFTSAKRSQLEHKKYNDHVDTAKVVKSGGSPARAFGDTPQPASSISGRDTTTTTTTSVDQPRDKYGLLIPAVALKKDGEAGKPEKDDEEDEDEEVVVVETEIITIPITSDSLSKDIKPAETGTGRHIVTASKSNEEKEEDKGVRTTLARQTASLYTTQTHQRNQAQTLTRPNVQDEVNQPESTAAASISNTSRSFVSQNASTPDASSRYATSTVNPSTRTTPTPIPTSSLYRPSGVTSSLSQGDRDVKPTTTSDVIGAPSSQQPAPPPPATTKTASWAEQSKARMNRLYASQITTTTPSSSSTSSSSDTSSMHAKSSVSTTATAVAAAASTTILPSTTTTTTTNSSSASSSSSSSLYSSGYSSRRYTPSLYQPLYQPPPPPPTATTTATSSVSSSSVANQSGTIGNNQGGGGGASMRENIYGRGAGHDANATVLSTTMTDTTTANTSTTRVQSDATTPNTPSGQLMASKRDEKEDTPSRPTNTRYSLYQAPRSLYAPPPAANQPPTPKPDDAKMTTTTTTKAQDVTSQTTSYRSTVTSSNAKDDAATNTTRNETKAPTTNTTTTSSATDQTSSVGSSSMYSRFYSTPNSLYSNPNSLYSNPAESKTATAPTTVVKPTPSDASGHVVSFQDQRVDETFTEAESARRRYDPAAASSKQAARSRRHTVEISKTLPEGVRILDLYKGNQDHDTARDDVTTLQRRGTEVIEESPTEAETVDDKIAAIHAKTTALHRPRILNSASGATPHNTTTGGGMPPRQHSLPDRFSASSSSSTRGEMSTKARASYHSPLSPSSPPSSAAFITAGYPGRHHHPPPSPTSGGRLSSSSSPAGSPMTDEKRSILSSLGEDDETEETGGPGAATATKNLKDIARKKRERWRRLTVY